MQCLSCLSFRGQDADQCVRAWNACIALTDMLTLELRSEDVISKYTLPISSEDSIRPVPRTEARAVFRNTKTKDTVQLSSSVVNSAMRHAFQAPYSFEVEELQLRLPYEWVRAHIPILLQQQSRYELVPVLHLAGSRLPLTQKDGRSDGRGSFCFFYQVGTCTAAPEEKDMGKNVQVVEQVHWTQHLESPIRIHLMSGCGSVGNMKKQLEFVPETPIHLRVVHRDLICVRCSVPFHVPDENLAQCMERAEYVHMFPPDTWRSGTLEFEPVARTLIIKFHRRSHSQK